MRKFGFVMSTSVVKGCVRLSHHFTDFYDHNGINHMMIRMGESGLAILTNQTFIEDEADMV